MVPAVKVSKIAEAISDLREVANLLEREIKGYKRDEEILLPDNVNGMVDALTSSLEELTLGDDDDCDDDCDDDDGDVEELEDDDCDDDDDDDKGFTGQDDDLEKVT